MIMDSVNCRLTSHGLISNGSSTNINVTNANNNSNTITSNNLNSTNNINLNNNLNNANANNNHQNMNGGPNNNLPVADLRQQYTMAGIVQFLQYEWQRFELHRQQWEVEKSELQARIALLQGERKGQENLKNDLIRRIKMLEYCLKQERAKYHKLKYGVDPTTQTDSPNDSKDINFELDENVDAEQKNNEWKQGRQLLQHYLQEIGYTDTIIDVRSNRVRSLLGLSNLNDDDSEIRKTREKEQKQAVMKMLAQLQTKKKKSANLFDTMVNDTESSVLATFEFLNNQNDHEMMENVDIEDEDVIDHDANSTNLNNDSEEVVNEFDIIYRKRMDANKNEPKWRSPNAGKDIDLGDLAFLTDTENVIENSTTLNVNNSSEVRKTWSQKYILKSHYDCIRSLRFHATEPLLITASDDETLKLWNINKSQPNKAKQPINTANATLDLEPIYTYRGHTSRVLSVCISGNVFHSGSQNGELIAWSIPSKVMSLDIYDPYDYSLQISKIREAHKDAIWSLASMTSAASNSNILCSASADQTIKIWDTTRSICMKSIEFEDKTPTDLTVIGSMNLNLNVSSTSLLLSSFDDGSLALYDIEAHDASKPVLSFDKISDSGSIYSIAVHPLMPIVITAHSYRFIKLWDINTGQCIHSMVAHLDEVSSVDCDPNGWYILSGSHDCSVRLWNFDNKNCVQEITSHRRKFDESIFDVTFHPSKPYFASAGADGLAKVFV
ncbi:glutamate receptor [Sarcoptes scabiei]|nr:glutamate receptor [Sarcoptes scabiei]